MGLLGMLEHGDMGWGAVLMGLLVLLEHGLWVSTDGPSGPVGTWGHGWGSVLMGLLGLLGHGDMGWGSVLMGLLGLLEQFLL